MTSPCDLQAVLVSADARVLDSLSSSLKPLGINAGVYKEASSAIETLSRQKTDAFFVDGEVDPELSLLKAIRSSNSSRGAVAFAIVSQRSSPTAAFRVADFVIDKPLALPRLGRTLRAAYGIMLKERIRYYRHSLRIDVALVDGSHRSLLAQTSNISQTGIGLLQCNSQLNTQDVVQLEFSLPDDPRLVNCKAQVIWTAENGKAGLTFTQMRKGDRDRLAGWIEEEFHRRVHSFLPPIPNSRFSDATS